MAADVKTSPKLEAKGSRDKNPILPLAVQRDIILLICIKLAVLWIIYQMFFKPYEIPVFQPAEISGHILDHSHRQ
jgi:hypothetical protein